MLPELAVESGAEAADADGGASVREPAAPPVEPAAAGAALEVEAARLADELLAEPLALAEAAVIGADVGVRGAPAKLVLMWTMSLPCTTSWSLERLRSRVRVSVERRVSDMGTMRAAGRARTLCSEIEIDGLSNRDVDDAEEPLVLLLELFLVKDLNRYDRRVFDFDVERLVPVCKDARDREGGRSAQPLCCHFQPPFMPTYKGSGFSEGYRRR